MLDRCALMAELDEGREWWVVAMVRDPLPELPQWAPPPNWRELASR